MEVFHLYPSPLNGWHQELMMMFAATEDSRLCQLQKCREVAAEKGLFQVANSLYSSVSQVHAGNIISV